MGCSSQSCGGFFYWMNIRNCLSLFPACQQSLDLLDGVDDAGNGHVMVQGHDEVCGVLGDVNIDVPVTGQQLRHTVGQVGAGDVVQNAVGHSLVELLEAAGEEREGGVGDDALCAALFQVGGNFQHALAGSDDVVSDEDGLALNGIAQILVSDDGVAAIDHAGVIAALVEHTQVAAQHAEKYMLRLIAPSSGLTTMNLSLSKLISGFFLSRFFRT